MDSGIKIVGTLGATCWVVASNAIAKVKQFAQLLQNSGYPVWVCDGTNDHVEIQAAIDALPATGGEVRLLDGTFNIAASINLDSNQTLRGNGRNTTLTTSTVNLVFISAIGNFGNEKIGVVISDMQIDGATVSDVGIYFNYVDYSLIKNVYSRRHSSGTGTRRAGIYLLNSDFNTVIGNILRGSRAGIHLVTNTNTIIMGNVFQGNTSGMQSDGVSNSTISDNICQGNSEGIWFTSHAYYNVTSGNICQGNSENGIHLAADNHNTVSGNNCQGNGTGIAIDNNSGDNTVSHNVCQGNTYYGIKVEGNNNILQGNECRGNGYNGIYLDGDNNNIIGNICIANSQSTDNTQSNIHLASSNYNLIIGNFCRDGGGAKQPQYGINVRDAGCNKNFFVGNDLYDSGRTGNLNDAGILTMVGDDNREIEITQVKHYENVKNTSGGALAAGDVVVLKAVAAGNEITTTTTEGDQLVFGMVAEAINNNAFGYVQVKGKTTVLKVDGTTDIAIGDLIGCFTTAKIGMKAASGKMAFAIALEAYTTDDSAGVIDALIISPRQAV